MGIVLALLPSPLLGPAVWQPVAARLSHAGWTVTAITVPSAAASTPGEVLQSYLDSLPANQDLVLIPHSNAGLYAPVLTTQRRVTACVFTDAGLPATYGQVPLAPAALHDFLAGKADDNGLLPPWTSWWDDTDVADLFPNIETRQLVEREQQRLPLTYFTQSLPVPAGWDDLPGAYLAFGDTYAAEAQQAAHRGWPVRTLRGKHLHMLVDPGQVALELSNLLTEVGISR